MLVPAYLTVFPNLATNCYSFVQNNDDKVINKLACSRLRDGGGKSFSTRNAKNARGLGTDPFPKSCPSYFRFARFNTFPLYYLRAWHRLSINYLAQNNLTNCEHFVRTLYLQDLRSKLVYTKVGLYLITAYDRLTTTRVPSPLGALTTSNVK